MTAKHKIIAAALTTLFIIYSNTAATAQLTLGGYGEIAISRNLYSDNINRYSHAADYANASSHGRVDLPHAAFATAYKFNTKWHIYSEVEYEHGGAESAVELEADEAGEYEQEIERGGEVALEQLWVEYNHNNYINLRIGHIIVPVGYTNPHHLPTEFFTMYRPEGEATILPCTWHQTGISIWGRIGKWKYELQGLPALDADLFSRTRWVGGAAASPYEFAVANKYAGLLRIDNYSIAGLRMGLCGYYGHSFRNSIQQASAVKYDKIKGKVSIISFDFQYDNYNVVARGNADYGHLTDSEAISVHNKGMSKNSPSPRTVVGSDAIAAGAEVGYNILACFKQINPSNRLYLYARYEYYDAMYKTAQNITRTEWCGRQRMAAGINYFPIKEVVVKAEYSIGILKPQYNNEPSINIGIAFAGFFNRWQTTESSNDTHQQP
jgi:hypothetical protein